MRRADSQRFAGKRVLITGASQGIGEDAVRRFAMEGAQVALNARKTDHLKNVLEKMDRPESGSHLIVPGDMAKERDVERVMRQSLEHFGNLDVLICNAGIQRESPSEKISAKDFNAVMAVNVTGVVLCARAALAHWMAHKTPGNIIVNSSVHQQIPKPFFLGYSASKGAVGNVVRTLALEFARHNIRVNAVAPGAIITPINDAWTKDKKRFEETCRNIPMRRPGECKEISDALTFLASEESSYITGQTLFVDGGLTLYRDFEDDWSS